MPRTHFDVFAETIKNLPVKAILKVLDLECKMIKSDLEFHRLSLHEDTLSILCFRHFVSIAKQEKKVRFIVLLPPDHIEFYKQTIVRLVHANELPPFAMDQFDYAISLY